MEEAKRRRRRHSAELKRQILEACAQPGASVAAIALAHGINANVVHKWRRAAHRASAVERPVAAPVQSFVPLSLPPAAPASSVIEIDLRRGATAVQIRWPQSAAAECAAWLRSWLA